MHVRKSIANSLVSSIGEKSRAQSPAQGQIDVRLLDMRRKALEVLRRVGKLLEGLCSSALNPLKGITGMSMAQGLVANFMEPLGPGSNLCISAIV